MVARLIGVIVTCAVFCAYSCQKAQPFTLERIEELTKHQSPETSEFVNCRLSLGLIVSELLAEHPEFWTFVNQELFKSEDGPTEMIIASHLEEVISSDGKTLRELIDRKAEQTGEITSIYEGDFVQHCMEVDPMVAIVCPRLFENLIRKDMYQVAPVIYVDAASSLETDGIIGFNFLFHGSGYRAFCSRRSFPEYLGLTLKYSEDYLLIHPEEHTLHNDIPIDYLYPQLRGHWEAFFSDMDKSVNYHSVLSNHLIVSKKSIKDYFNNEVKKSFSFFDLNQCNEPCIRECFDDEEITDVLVDLEIRDDNSVAVFIDKSLVFEEKYSFIFHFFEWGNEPDILISQHIEHNIDPYLIHNYTNTLEVYCESEKYELLGTIYLPRLNGTFEWEDSHEVHDMYIPFERKWDRDMDGVSRGLATNLISFRDKVDDCSIPYNILNPGAVTHLPCSKTTNISTRAIHYCDVPFGYYDSGLINYSMGLAY
jgi:hypothetical protein